MISMMRHAIVDSWLGRVLAIAVFVSFVGWGIGDVALFMSSETDVAAKVGQHRISERELAMFLRSELPSIAQKMGVGDPSQIPYMLRQQIAYQILQRLVSRVDILEQARHSGIVVPDSALRDEIFSLPYFRNAQGIFDRQAFDQQISAQGLTEKQVFDMIRDDLAARAVLQPLARSGYIPETIVRQIAIHEGTKKTVDFVNISDNRQNIPFSPTQRDLERTYKNHPWAFMIPEYRRAHIAILSPQTVAPTIQLTQEQYKNYYDAQSAHYHQPQTRDIRLILMSSQDRAQQLARQWRDGQPWSKLSQEASGSATEMSRVRPSAIPSQDLRDYIFKAPQQQIQGPYHTDAGWAVFDVPSVHAPKNVALADAKAEILDAYRKASQVSIAMEKQRAFQDAVVGGGMQAVAQIAGVYEGDVDINAQGITRDHKMPSVPADATLRANIIAHIFQTKPDDSPALEQGGDGTLFAVQTDQVTPSRLAPYADIQKEVTSYWYHTQKHHKANEVATNIYRNVKQPTDKDIQSTVQRNVQYSPATPRPQLPQLMKRFLDHGRAGELMMADSKDGYIVAKIDGITLPNFEQVSQLSHKVRGDLEIQAGNDLVVTYLQLLARRYRPDINAASVQRALSVAGFGDGPS